MAIAFKTSRAWLNKYFEKELPSVEEIGTTLTNTVAEIEEARGDRVEVNVLPDRAAYLLSHRGVALELGTALNESLSSDPLQVDPPSFPSTDRVKVSLPETGCARYMVALIEGVTVGPSPAWLTEALESVGQRSINNVVDATNYVMLDIGQPLHAFDADKLGEENGTYSISVRSARVPERMTTLSGECYDLPEGTLVIADEHAQSAPLGIAGIKGGDRAQVTESTTNLIIEAANFDGTRVRKTAQRLKLFTDASSRFQNKPSPELVSYGMQQVLTLITDIAGGTLVGVVDTYPASEEPKVVTVNVEKVNAVLGSSFTNSDIEAALTRLRFAWTAVTDGYAVRVPFWRNDLTRAEDVVEEIGRTIGYEHIAPVPLPSIEGTPDQAKYRGIERIKDFLVERGYVELSTPSFAETGDILLANPLQADKPYLRARLEANIREALSRGVLVAPRALGPVTLVRVFEIGSVFKHEGEPLMLSLGVAVVSGKASLAADALRQDMLMLENDLLGGSSNARYSTDATIAELDIGSLNLEKLGEAYAPLSVRLSSFRPYSSYPFALRDVAVWTPSETSMNEVEMCIVKEAGEHLARIDLFDRFEKEGRVSYAFRLVFESMERTLADTDLEPAMEHITTALNSREGWEVR